MAASWFVHDYDQISTPPNQFEILDLAIPAFLDAVPKFQAMRRAFHAGRPSSLTKTLGELARTIRRVPIDRDLWDVQEPEVRDILAPLFEAATKIVGFGPAVASKLLHRKRPRMIPVIDSYAENAWGTEQRLSKADRMLAVTTAMRNELGERRRSRAETRSVAEALGDPYAKLSDLRLYDLLAYQAARSNST
ncbi:MAG: DUF6308 family protein [Vicinamibacterales bacterium]